MIRSCSLAVLFALSITLAAQTTVRHPEGRMRGFVTLEDMAGRNLASGELTQTVSGVSVTSRLLFHFRDGSVDDETSVFTQRGTLQLVKDHHVQYGPSYPKATDLEIDVTTGNVTARTVDADGKQKNTTEHVELPAGLLNGMILATFENLNPATPETRLPYLALGGKPRLIHAVIRPAGPQAFTIGTLRRTATEYVVHFDLGGVAGVVAPLIGKEPEDVRLWVLGGDAPLVVREEGQFFEDGPVWRIVLANPAWSASASRRTARAQSGRK